MLSIKNDYSFILPLTDSNGSIFVEKNWLIKFIKIQKDLSIIDFASELEDCSSQIEIRILNKEELTNAITAMKYYQPENMITDLEIIQYENADNYKYQAKTVRFPIDESTNELIIELELAENLK